MKALAASLSAAVLCLIWSHPSDAQSATQSSPPATSSQDTARTVDPVTPASQYPPPAQTPQSSEPRLRPPIKTNVLREPVDPNRIPTTAAPIEVAPGAQPDPAALSPPRADKDPVILNKYDATPPVVEPNPTVLQGGAEIRTIQAGARLMAGTPLTHHRDRSVRFVELKIKNTSNQPLVIDGEQIEAVVDNRAVRQSSKRELEKDASSALSWPALLSVVFVEGASLGLAGPLYYEFITPGENRKRNLARALGRDGVRHEIEAENVRRRILMPGDETTGWLAFDSDNINRVSGLRVPVSYLPPTAPGGVLTVKVESGRANSP